VVEHGEIQAVDIRDVLQLTARDVADAGRSTLTTSAPNHASNCVQVVRLDVGEIEYSNAVQRFGISVSFKNISSRLRGE